PTLAPVSTISRAVSAPMPRAAPEISATLPSSRFIARPLKNRIETLQRGGGRGRGGSPLPSRPRRNLCVLRGKSVLFSRVAAAIKPQVIAEIRPHAFGPGRVGRGLPRRRVRHVGIGEII